MRTRYELQVKILILTNRLNEIYVINFLRKSLMRYKLFILTFFFIAMNKVYLIGDQHLNIESADLNQTTVPTCAMLPFLAMQDDPPFPWPHKFSLSPEFYHVSRSRRGGTQQSGWIYGGRFSYERIKYKAFYYALVGLYAEGGITGMTASKKPLKSNFIDKQIEGRFGYNFQWDFLCQPSIIPYIGAGYFSESNNYRSPSPVLVNFEIEYPFFAFGFTSSIMLFKAWQLGFNFEGRAAYQTNCKVTNDPDYSDCNMCVGDRFNYRLELPVVYRLPFLYETFEIGAVPFYEYRHYGDRMNYPFDFLDTRVNIYGVNIQFNIRL